MEFNPQNFGPKIHERYFHQAATPVIVEDLIQGMNEWRNIQDIVRLTFKAFHDVLKAQGEAIKSLERSCDSKASRAEVAAALQLKANNSEVANRLREIEGQVLCKADVSEVERRALRTDVESALKAHISDTYAAVATKTDESEFRVWKDQSERMVSGLRTDLARLNSSLQDALQGLDTKANVLDVSHALDTKADAILTEEKLQDKVSRKHLGDALAKKADRMALEVMEADIRQGVAALAVQVANKSDARNLEELSARTERIRDTLEQDSNATATALRSLSTTFDAALSDMRKRNDQALTQSSTAHDSMVRLDSRTREQEAVLKDLAMRKAEAHEVQRLLDSKADMGYVNEALARKANTAVVTSLVEKVETAVDAATRAATVREEMAAKANTKDVCTLLDSKSNIEDVNRALLEVCSELEKKAGAEALNKVVRDQGIINASLTADMSVARWIWKSGKTKAGNAVPWNVQSLNSDPENFIWERDKVTVMTVVPGLYEVIFGFFARKKPVVQLLVNGEPVLSAVNNSSYVVHHSSGRLAAVGNHPAGNVTGLTCIDFLSLPPRAKLCITYQGEEKAEGFLSLKKL